MGTSLTGGEQRYWLLAGSAPTGPFTVEQVHAKLAAGEITWETRACPLGKSIWLPLAQTPGLGPTPVPEGIPSVIPVPPPAVTASPRPVLTALPADADGVRGVAPQPLEPVPGGGRPSPARRWAGAAVALLALAFLGWLGYEGLRPLTPREVCERFDKAKTAKEASRYCTLNLQPAVEAMFRQPGQEHPEDKFEYTQEGEAPAGVGGFFVGVRGQLYIPEERRRMQFDGVYHLIKSDGWKIEDMYCVSVDRQQLPEPISVARDYPLLLGQQPGGQFAQQAPRDGPAATTPTQAKAWYDNRGVQQATARGIAHLLTSGGGKALGVVLLAGLVAVVRFGREIVALLGSVFSGQQARG